MAAQSKSQALLSRIPRTKGNIPEPLWEQYFEKIGYTLRYNQVTGVIEANGQPLTDATSALIRVKLRDIDCSQNAKPTDLSSRFRVSDGIDIVSSANAYHPIKKYLDFCAEIYEKSEKVDWVTQLLGAIESDDEEVVRSFFVKWLVGCCARIYENFQNYCLIFYGKQGIGKSSMFEWLTSGIKNLYEHETNQYFQEGELDPSNKDHADYLASKWIWEIGEIGGTMGKKDRNALKEFITRTQVSQRSAYARFVTTRPRICNLSGSTNDDTFLTDPTGNRRFLVIPVKKIDFSYNDKSYKNTKMIDVDLLWGQIMGLYLNKEISPTLSTYEKLLQAQTNAKYEATDAFEEYLKLRYVTSDNFTTTLDILQRAIDDKIIRDGGRSTTMRLSEIANRLDWEKVRQDGVRGLRGYKVKLIN